MMTPFPTGPAFEGTIVFCPQCYPTIGMHGDQRHFGDFLRDFPGCKDIDLYDMHGERVTNVYRAVFPYNGPPIVEQDLMSEGRPVRCAECGVAFLRHVQAYEGLRIHFGPSFPAERIPYWLRPEHMADIDRIKTAARRIRE